MHRVRNNRQTDSVIDKLLGDLIEANEKTTDINMFNHIWTFKMLNAASHVEAISDSSGPIDRVARLFKLEMSTLRHALVAVDGQKITPEESEQLINNMPPLVIDRLSDAYEVFRTQTEQLVIGDKTTETPKEVTNEPEPEEPEFTPEPPKSELTDKPKSFADVVPNAVNNVK